MTIQEEEKKENRVRFSYIHSLCSRENMKQWIQAADIRRSGLGMGMQLASIAKIQVQQIRFKFTNVVTEFKTAGSIRPQSKSIAFNKALLSQFHNTIIAFHVMISSLIQLLDTIDQFEILSVFC